MIRSISPAARACRTFFLPAGVMEPVSSPTRTPAGSSRADRERKCCSASTSVGAMRADWYPAPAASQAA